MRVLACSDIHGNVEAVRRLRSAEKNVYDVIIVAGDLGRAIADIIGVFDSFGCPVAYVLGNHDFEHDYTAVYGVNDHHLHGRPLSLESCHIVGFSGCPTQWGRNPFAGQFNEQHEIYEANLSHTAAALDQCTRPDQCRIVVSHEYITRPHRRLPKADLFLHGHNHNFVDRHVANKRVINVAALDKCFSVIPKKGPNRWHEVRQINAGCYVSFLIKKSFVYEVQAHRFGFDMGEYEQVDGFHMPNVPVIGGDPRRDTIELGMT